MLIILRFGSLGVAISLHNNDIRDLYVPLLQTPLLTLNSYISIFLLGISHMCICMYMSYVSIEERPTMRQLQEVMRIDIGIATRWRDLGLELVDSIQLLRVIEANHPSDVVSCCIAMFEKWLERTPDASWSQLVTALNNIGMNTAADAVSKLLKSDSGM